MRGVYRFLKSTIIGGLGILVPLIALGAITVWAIQIALQLVMPIFEWLPDKSLGGVSVTVIAALLSLVLACFLAGLFAETAIIRGLGNRAERLALLVPGYSLMKNAGASLIGIESAQAPKTVLVQFEASWQLGFVMESLSDGRLVTFVPGAPKALVGTVHIVEPARVQSLGLSVSAALDVLGRLGVGLENVWSCHSST